jgi:hypothetical protein
MSQGEKRTTMRAGETPTLPLTDDQIFTPEGEIRRPSRFRPALSTKPLSEPLEPPPPPNFPPSDLRSYHGDHSWPWLRRLLVALVGAVGMSAVLMMGIVIGFSLARLSVSATPTRVATPDSRPAVTREPTVPAVPTPSPIITPRTFVAQAGRKQPTAAQGNSGEYESCIQGQVIDSKRYPISSAVLGLSNGNKLYETTTNAFGYYQFCGLGASPWSVTLFNIPPFEAELLRQPTYTIYLNGAQGQIAEVNFVER